MQEGTWSFPGGEAHAPVPVYPCRVHFTEGALVRLPPIVVFLALACTPYRVPDAPAPDVPTLPPPRVTAAGPVLQDLVTGTSQRLQAVSAAGENVVWVSGTGGTFGVSLDGGRSWRTGVVAGADSLEFRDVHAVNQRTAYLLAAGPGTNSRIYKTADGGQNWQLQFVNREPLAFFDCFDFWDEEHGLAWSDNVSGRFPVARTSNGGQRWTVSMVDGATEGEGAFAASGTCVLAHGKREVFVATGAGRESRIFRSPDQGTTWEAIKTPMVQGTNVRGHTSVTFRDDQRGLAAGGDIRDQDSVTDNIIVTRDGGRTWTVAARPTFTGAVYGAAYVPGGDGLVVAVGPKGASFSPDDGRTWQPLDTLEYWSATFVSRKAGWLVGPGGRAVKVRF